MPRFVTGERWSALQFAAGKASDDVLRPPVRPTGLIWRKRRHQMARTAMPPVGRPLGKPMLVRELLQKHIETFRERRIERLQASPAIFLRTVVTMNFATVHRHLNQSALLRSSEVVWRSAADTVPPLAAASALAPVDIKRSGAAARVMPGRQDHAFHPRPITRAFRRPPPAGWRGAEAASRVFRPFSPRQLHQRAPATPGDLAGTPAAVFDLAYARGNAGMARNVPATRAGTAGGLVVPSEKAPVIVWRTGPKAKREAAAPAQSVGPAAVQPAAKTVAPTAETAQPLRQSRSRPAANSIPQLDPVIAERLTLDVMRRIEQQLRINRERRGI